MSNHTEDELIEDLARFERDPLGFVMWCYPWGEEGTFLESEVGPDEWQTATLRKMRDELEAGGDAGVVVQKAIASGHGVGKSAMVAWLIQWGISTFPDTRGVVTANTEKQLTTKTWPELAKWHHLSIVKSLFTLTATAYFSRDEEHQREWRIDMVPWSEKNMEAFAGLHNKGKRIMLFMDEGSAIPDPIYETAEGALTDAGTQIIWIVAGNPTRNVGRFRECFGSLAHRWDPVQVDSRTCRHTNKEQIKKWEDDYGEDSDFFRIRVRGVFPREGAKQFISSEVVDEAQVREVPVHLHDPLVFGVDVARFGEDQSVIYIRKGRDGRTWPPLKFRGIDTMALASEVARLNEQYRPDAIFIDGGGVGGGVVDRLRQLRVPCVEVNFSGKPDRISINDEYNVYYNKRAEMWGNVRDWLKIGAIPKDAEIKQHCIQQTYDFRPIRGRDAILLTSKEDMKREGLESPDVVDALALTFAYPVMANADAGRPFKEVRMAKHHDYDPFQVDSELNVRVN